MKQYEVAIYPKYPGRVKADLYFCLILSHDSKEAAKDFAYDIVSNMTRQEFNDNCISVKPWIYELDKKVGEYANYYSYRVTKF